MTSATTDSADIIGVPHPVVTTPTTKVYHTPYPQGPVVTFFHKEHVDLFGLKCVNCHKHENCSNCHDLQTTEKRKRTQAEVHAVCSDCHKTDECAKCHGSKQKPAFTHDKTGWPLNRFHKDLDCRACHPTGKKIARLNNQCVGCHGGWTQGNFAHAVTGLDLDEKMLPPKSPHVIVFDDEGHFTVLPLLTMTGLQSKLPAKRDSRRQRASIRYGLKEEISRGKWPRLPWHWLTRG